MNENGSIFQKLLLLIIFLSLACSVLGSAVVPLGQMEHEFLYDFAQRIEAQSLDRFDYQLGPWEIDRFDFSPDRSHLFGPINTGELRLFSSLTEDVESARSQSLDVFESFRAGVAGLPSDRVFILADFLLDERKASDPQYSGKKWRGLAGRFENAFVRYQHPRFDFTLGRFASFWGPRNSLALASRVSMDGLGYSVRWGKLTLSYRLARLDGSNPDNDPQATVFENRYFAGHRLDIHLNRKLRLGLFETAVFGGEGRQIDLHYLNPIIFYHTTQLNEETDDNTMLGFDFVFKPMLGMKVYGQLLVDDLQIDNNTQSDEEPSELGILAGVELVDMIADTDFDLEYSRVDNRTFNQPQPRNRYTHEGQLIGGALGNDYDYLKIGATRWNSDRLAFLMSLALMRRGEGDPLDDWSTPWMLSTGDYSESFPTGTVEKTTSLAAGFKAFIVDHMFVSFEGGVNWIKNHGHVADEDFTEPFAKLYISTFFSHRLGIE